MRFTKTIKSMLLLLFFITMLQVSFGRDLQLQNVSNEDVISEIEGESNDDVLDLEEDDDLPEGAEEEISKEKEIEQESEENEQSEESEG